jgi:glycosyltransferase involved in cell wall biosynthesis
MRILVASASYPTPAHPEFLGGAETFSNQLCEALAKRGNEVCVVRSGPAWATWDNETANDVDVVTLPTRNLYSPWLNRSSNAYVRAVWHFIEDRSSASPGFDRVLREFVPDVFHTNGLYGLTTAVWAKARARHIPVVHTLHDYYLICARSRRFKNGARCHSSCIACFCLTNGRRRATAFIDTVVGVSERTLAIHRECGLFSDDVNKIIIRNPPPNVHGPVSPVQTSGDEVVFGFIGRPSVEKGILELLSSFRKVPRGLARLVVAGNVDAETNAQMLDFIGNSDVELLGFVTAKSFFERIDVLVIPSIWEDPCPMVIGESFAYARPVIGARRGGIPEMIRDEATGWQYEPNSGELENLLYSIAKDRASIAARSQYLLSKPGLRDFEDLVTNYIMVYSDAIANKGAGIPDRGGQVRDAPCLVTKRPL